jgi:lipid A ethanolaminephosphotransferase
MTWPEEQAQIPLIVKATVPITIEKRAAYSQPGVFDTVLDLFSIHSPGFDRAGSFIKKGDDSKAAAVER